MAILFNKNPFVHPLPKLFVQVPGGGTPLPENVYYKDKPEELEKTREAVNDAMQNLPAWQRVFLTQNNKNSPNIPIIIDYTLEERNNGQAAFSGFSGTIDLRDLRAKSPVRDIISVKLNPRLLTMSDPDMVNMELESALREELIHVLDLHSGFSKTDAWKEAVLKDFESENARLMMLCHRCITTTKTPLGSDIYPQKTIPLEMVAELGHCEEMLDYIERTNKHGKFLAKQGGKTKFADFLYEAYLRSKKDYPELFRLDKDSLREKITDFVEKIATRPEAMLEETFVHTHPLYTQFQEKMIAHATSINRPALEYSLIINALADHPEHSVRIINQYLQEGMCSGEVLKACVKRLESEPDRFNPAALPILRHTLLLYEMLLGNDSTHMPLDEVVKKADLKARIDALTFEELAKEANSPLLPAVQKLMSETQRQ